MKKGPSRRKNAGSTDVDFLSRQIESLDRESTSLSRITTFRELTRQCAQIVQSQLGAEPGIFHHPRDGSGWVKILGGGPDTFPHGVPGEIGGSFVLHELEDPAGALCTVQRLSDGSRLGMVLEARANGAPFSDMDRLSLQLLTRLFESSYASIAQRQNEKDLIFSLNHRVLQLNSLIDTGIEVSKLDEDARMFRLALERATSLTNASRGLLRISEGDTLREKISFPEGVVTAKVVQREHHISSGFSFHEYSYTLELFEKESRKGTVPFDDTDELLLNALTRQVHASLEIRFLHQQALEKQRMEHDLSVAAAIQKRIIPESLPVIEGYDLAGANIPSKSVGGDYYDCVPLSDGRYALVIADVAGKGIPAALLVSSFHAYLAAYLESGSSLVQIAQRLNRVIYSASTDDKFITGFLALLDPRSGSLETLSAGHNPVYWIGNDGTITELDTGGVAFGMIDMEFPYQSRTVAIEPGERLLLYTDGVTEAINEKEEQYDNVVSLKNFLMGQKKDGAGTVIQDLIDDIRRFCGTAPQADDITALYLIRR